MIRYLILSLFALLMNACISSADYYVLSNPSQPEKTYRVRQLSIGVEEVKVPKYLFKRELAVAKSPQHIVFLSHAKWAEDLNEGLQRRLVGYLQKALHDPYVYTYPWGVNEEPAVRIKVNITRFIAQGGSVYLDANWVMEDLRTGKREAHLFATSVPAKEEDAESIVSAMDAAFRELEDAIAHRFQ